MSLKLTEEQAQTLERIVREVTVQALTPEARAFIHRMLLAGASPHEIVALVQEQGGSVLLQNATRWYAEDMEGQLMFVPAEGAI